MGREVFVGSPPEALPYEDVVRRLAGFVYGVAYGVLKTSDLAGDASQEAFLALLAHDDPFPSEAALRGWLGRVTYHAALKTLRGRRRRRRREEVVAARSAKGGGAVYDADTHAAESSAALRRLVDELPDEQRLAVRLKYFEGVPQTEIAAVLGCSTGTVSNRLKDGLTRLRAVFARAGAAGVALPALEGSLAALDPDPVPSTLLPRLLGLEGAATTLATSGGTTVITKIVLSGVALAVAALGLTYLAPVFRGEPESTDPSPTVVGRVDLGARRAPHLAGRAPGAAPVRAEPDAARASDAADAPGGGGAPPAAAWMTMGGIVLDPEGRPAVGARVRVHSPPKSKHVVKAETKTGDDGTWRVGGLPAGSGWVVRVRHPGAAPWSLHFLHLHPGVATGLEVRLHASWSVRGVMLDAQGDPIVGHVPFDVVTPNTSGRSRLEGDETGAFTIRDLDPKKQPPEEATIVIRHPDYRPHRIEGVGDRIGPDGWAHVEVRLERGAGIEGVVRALDGKPLNRARFTLLPAGVKPSMFSWDERRFRPDEEGRFSVRGLEPGEHVIRGWAPGLVVERPFHFEVEGEETFAHDLHLGTGRTLTGRVVDANGRPVPGAEIGAPDPTGMRPFGVEHTADAEGRFRITGLGLARRTFHFHVTGVPLLNQDSFVVEVVRSSPREMEIVLRTKAALPEPDPDAEAATEAEDEPARQVVIPSDSFVVEFPAGD